MRIAALPVLMLTLGALSACGTNTEESAASGAGGGAVAGAVVGGPVGALAGAAVGAGAGTAKEKVVDKDGKPVAHSRTANQGMTGSTAPAEPATPPPPSGKGYGYGTP